MAAIYLVKTPSGESLVKADNKQQAINFIIRKDVTAEALTSEQTVDYAVGKQMAVLDAKTIPSAHFTSTTENQEG